VVLSKNDNSADRLWIRSLKLETQMPQMTSQDKLTGHDFWSNSVESIANDDDVTQFLADNESQSEKLLVALNALETTYSQIKAEAEAVRDEAEDEDEEDGDIPGTGDDEDEE